MGRACPHAAVQPDGKPPPIRMRHDRRGGADTAPYPNGYAQSSQDSAEAFRFANPGAVAFALECGCVQVVFDYIIQLGFCQFELAFLKIELGKLDFGSRVGVAPGDELPGFYGRILFPQSRKCFGICHHGVTVLVLRVFANDGFQQRPCFGWPVQT